jgi:ABC-type dipeptide/oligopeptide/nickel transport system permease component
VIPFVARRLLLLVPVLFGVTVFVFVLIHLAPGDPITAMLGVLPRSPEEVTRLRHLLGLDQSLPVQYLVWLSRVVQLDLGTSLYAHAPVVDLIAQRLPTTISLAVTSMLLAIVLGLSLGVISATKQGTWVDNVARLVSVIGVSMPVFWLGMLLIIVFALVLRVLPPGGSIDEYGPIALLLPSLTLGAAFSAVILRLTRSSMLEILSADYIRTARSKGLLAREIQFRHALRNALIPVITVTGLQAGTLLSGAVLTETIFSLPGLGRLMTEAVGARDYPLVLGSVLAVSTVFVLVNLVVDVLYAVVDPRIRLG